MKIIKERIILPSIHHNKSILGDIRYVENHVEKPLVLFIHGFKGFKDWGHFNLMADQFAANGFAFLKINLSHNGTTPDQPTEFADLEAFAENNYEIELDDIKTTLDYICSDDFEFNDGKIMKEKIYLVGHSRGGGICILKASEDTRIKKLATWAAVSNFTTWWSEDFLAEWKRSGIQYIYNSRTKQEMPMKYQLIENFNQNKDRYSIPSAAQNLSIPYLIVHGDADATVSFESAKEINENCPEAELCVIQGANHTFGGKHPYDESDLPQDTWKALSAT